MLERKRHCNLCGQLCVKGNVGQMIGDAWWSVEGKVMKRRHRAGEFSAQQRSSVQHTPSFHTAQDLKKKSQDLNQKSKKPGFEPEI